MSSPTTLAADALLFDLDGVLVDSTANVERHWRDWATSRGLDVARILSVVHGRRAIDTIREQAPHLDAERELAALVAAESSETRGITVIPGAAELLASLPEERWAIVTSGPHPVALARLHAVGLPVPRVLVTADRVKAGKPDPEGYLAAARTLGAAPARCVVVEDAPAGVEAARRGGMRCVAVLTTHRSDELRGATVITRELRDIVVEPVAPSGLVVSVRTREEACQP
ncbi:MAG TPA: HAD family hydrolase [Gemmatimonadaceae bacterium]